METESSVALQYLERRQKEEIGNFEEYQKKIKSDLKRVSRKLCKHYLKTYGKELSKTEKMFYKKNMDSYLNELIETSHSTKFENPVLISILHDLNLQLQEGVKNVSVRTEGIEYNLQDSDVFDDMPYIGTLPIGEVNAEIRYFPTSKEYLIIFQDGIFDFCNLFSKVIASSFRYLKDEIVTERDGEKVPPIGYKLYAIEEKEIKKTLKENPQIYENFKDLIISYVLKGKPGFAKQYFIDPKYELSVENLRNGMELFVLGHEYAHKFFGHLESDDTALFSISKSDAKRILYDWGKEYEADAGGLMLALGALGNRYTAPKSYLGTELILTGFEIVQKSLCILENGHDHFYWRGGRSDGPLGSHPPPDQRREKLRIIAKHLGEKDITKYAEKVDIVINELWKKLKPELIVMYDKQIKSSPIWRDSNQK